MIVLNLQTVDESGDESEDSDNDYRSVPGVKKVSCFWLNLTTAQSFISVLFFISVSKYLIIISNILKITCSTDDRFEFTDECREQ